MKNFHAPLFPLALCTAVLAFLISSLVAAENNPAPPKFRPAEFGQGPKSFRDLVDYPKRALKNREPGMVLFQCTVTKQGKGMDFILVKASDRGDSFVAAVKKAVGQGRFDPAQLEGKGVDACLAGAVCFAVEGDQPRILLYLSMNEEEIKAGHNYIQPQMMGSNADFMNRVSYPGEARKQRRTGEAMVGFTIGVDGQVKDLRVVKEEPAGHGFGEAVLNGLKKTTFVPALRDGKPEESAYFHRQYFDMNNIGQFNRNDDMSPTKALYKKMDGRGGP